MLHLGKDDFLQACAVFLLFAKEVRPAPEQRQSGVEVVYLAQCVL